MTLAFRFRLKGMRGSVCSDRVEGDGLDGGERPAGVEAGNGGRACAAETPGPTGDVVRKFKDGGGGNSKRAQGGGGGTLGPGDTAPGSGGAMARWGRICTGTPRPTAFIWNGIPGF